MKPSTPLILGINGFKKSGKTTLIEQLLVALAPTKLRLAVIKSHNEPVETDPPGTDTSRFYQAGADILGYDGQSVYLKRHQSQSLSLDEAWTLIGNQYDLILVEGYKQSQFDKIWLLREDETAPPENIPQIIAVLDWTSQPEERLKQALKLLQPRLEKLRTCK